MRPPLRALSSTPLALKVGWLLLVLLFCVAEVLGAAPEPIRIGGAAVMVEAYYPGMQRLRDELGIEAKIGSGLNANAALNAVGLGVIDLALVTRHITQADRSQFPAKRMIDVLVGWQVLVPAVPAEIWAQGIHTISREEFIRLYEGEAKTWKDFGGGDREIKFFNPEKGHGSWELFAAWLYGESRMAPLGEQWETVATPRATRDSIEFNSSSISVLPPKWIDGRGVYGLGIKTEEGETLWFSEAAVRDGSWPMVRPLYLVSGDRPTGRIRKVMEALVGDLGRDLFENAALIPRLDASEELRARIR